MKLLLPALLLIGCFSCKSYTADNLPAERLHFGNKGGVTGQLREYILLLDSGKLLFHDPLTDEYEQVAKLKSDRLQQIVTELATLDFSPATASGNYNTLLVHHTGTEQKEIQWSSPRSAPSKATQTFFESLMATVKAERKNR